MYLMQPFKRKFLIEVICITNNKTAQFGQYERVLLHLLLVPKLLGNEARSLPPLRGEPFIGRGPGVSLRSTPGYSLGTLRVPAYPPTLFLLSCLRVKVFADFIALGKRDPPFFCAFASLRETLPCVSASFPYRCSGFQRCKSAGGAGRGGLLRR